MNIILFTQRMELVIFNALPDYLSSFSPTSLQAVERLIFNAGLHVVSCKCVCVMGWVLCGCALCGCAGGRGEIWTDRCNQAISGCRRVSHTGLQCIIQNNH